MNALLPTRQIGQTPLRVTDVSFGSASIGNLYRAVSEKDARHVLDAAWVGGVRYFDTAPHYGRGLSEARLGAFLSDKLRDDFVVSSKVGRVLSAGAQQSEADGFIDPLPNDVRYDYSGDGIEEAFESSCERLGLSRIDILFVHDIGSYTHGIANQAHMEAFLGSGYERLVRLKEQGKIQAFGLGVNENQVCLDVMKHGPLDVILLAGRLTLLDRSAKEALVPACIKAGTSLVLGGIFNSGVLATGPVDGATYDYGPAGKDILGRVTVLQAKAEALGLPLATAALQFAIAHSLVASVLIGTAKASTLRKNIDAIVQPLPTGFKSTFDVG